MRERRETTAGQRLKEKGLNLALAESLTGGLVSHMVTNVPGSSEWFKGGVVAYTDEVKKSMQGVKATTLKKYGPVSMETAKEMAAGIRKKLKSDIGLAATGIAGPTGGTREKPVGTVFIAISGGKRTYGKRLSLKGTRGAIKKKAANAALKTLWMFLK
ncbi:MAG: nicotinamide-nucleotide amidohydrolase family protein [Deltaproteobacteria bacterium]|nr:nicotinamide-nucleotide amidohydrolase family protein [Deltaproteobacteria bacterium]